MFDVSCLYLVFAFYLTNGALNNYAIEIAWGTLLGSVVILLMGVLPNLRKYRVVEIELNQKQLNVFATDYQNYQIAIQDIVQISSVKQASRTSWVQQFIILKNGDSYKIPGNLGVPTQKIVYLLKEINPQIQINSAIKY